MESVDGKFTVTGVEERIWKLLSKWKALAMAVENQWGGPDSILKSQKLASDVLSCLFLSKGEVKVEDLENLLHESLLLSFNTEIEDGSIDQVAEQLMNIREEYLQGNINIISVK
ncbi:PREDICTED: pre-rRNA-processing protein TSR2 homolog [Erythranthe guttata]|nr:PREDICTED: pre-rRNA-processing protein TSR2 homolog [Erythranthe guttata]|eukprot:XP_012842045.1 PREDICTED: pre-rRNA-processing protein TSR2 homolog [Erythranthe guttata]